MSLPFLSRKGVFVTALVTCAACLSTMSQPAMADCSVTSGSGTVSNPANGDIITCAVAGGGQVTTIGSLAPGVMATVNIEDNALISVTGSNGISLDSSLVSFGSGSTLQTLNSAGILNFASNPSASLIMGPSSQIFTTGNSSQGYMIIGNNTSSATVTMSGDNAQINTVGADSGGIVVFAAASDATGTVQLSGNNSQINTSGTNAAGITVVSVGGEALANVTLAQNSSIASIQNIGIFVFGGATGNPSSVIDSAGAIIGGSFSIALSDGDDFLTLRTGASLTSSLGVHMGDGNDTLTLIGNGTEDETFASVEEVEVNADAIGWNLTGSSGFNNVNVNTGLFRNNGSLVIGGDLMVDNGAIYGGSGTTIGNVSNYGSLAPGNSIGTQNISGNYVQDASGTLEIEFDNTSLDLLNISGTASLDGTVRFTELAPGVALDTPMVFLDAAGGISGSFSTISTVFLSGQQLRQAEIALDPTQASVTFSPYTPDFEGQGGTVNEKAAGKLVDRAIIENPTAAVDIINTLNSSNDIKSVLASQSGIASGVAVLSASAALSDIIGIVREKAEAGKDSGSTGKLTDIEPAAGKEKRKYWLQATRGSGGMKNDRQARAASYKSYGVAAGKELMSEKGKILGLFAAVSETDSSISGLADKAEVEAYQSGIYGGYDMTQNWHANGMLSAAWLDFETIRPTSMGNASADYSGYSVFGYSEAIYDINPSESFVVSPFAGFEGGLIYRDGYREHGAAPLNMVTDNDVFYELSSIIGMQAKGSYEFEEYNVIPSLKLGWKHQYLDNGVTQKMSYADIPEVISENKGVDRSRNSAIIGTELSIEGYRNYPDLYFSYNGDITKDARDHKFRVGLSMKW